MSFQSLQQAFNIPISEPQKQSDPTKDIYEQGKNFAREMAGERGIMAAIEGAHLRPYIQKYIKNKLLTSDDPIGTVTNDINKVREGASRLLQFGGRDLRGLSTERNPANLPRVTENKVLAGNPETQEPLTSTIETGGRPSTLRGARDVGKPEGEGEFDALTGERLEGTVGSRQALRQQAITEAETDPVSFGKAPAGSLGGPEESPFFREAPAVPRGVTADTPFEALFRNPPSTEAELRESAARATSRSGGIRATPRPRATEDLPAAEREAVSLRETAQAGRTAGQLIEPTPAPVVPVLPPRPAPARAIPKPEPEAPTPSASTPAAEKLPEPARPGPIEPTEQPSIADMFPSPPQTTPGRITESGEFEGGPIPAPARARPQPEPAARTQTQEPQTEEKPIETDEYGLPKLNRPPPTAEEQESIDREIAGQLAKTEVKTAPEEAAESEVPGVGTLLAVGTALYGVIKSSIEAHKEKVQAEQYKPPPMQHVAMDSVPTFDSVFRG